jgi:hypothetical protein
MKRTDDAFREQAFKIAISLGHQRLQRKGEDDCARPSSMAMQFDHSEKNFVLLRNSVPLL